MSEKQTVILEDLVGRHLLTAVDYGSETLSNEYGGSADADYIRFTLDGRTYTVVEDPEDGYRSSHRDVIVDDTILHNRFSPVSVLAVHVTMDKYGDTSDLLRLYSDGGKLILQAGTGNTDDYYPYFVASFDPTALPMNQGPNDG